jgi:hypothetical protein
MTMPSTHPPDGFAHGATMRHLMVNMSRAMDESPDEVELLHRLIITVLHERFPNAADAPQHELFNALEPVVRARMESSAQHRAAMDAIMSRYEALPTNEEIRLARDGHNSIIIAIGVGLALGVLFVAAVCIYLSKKY